ncbi:MAG: S24/S26 family peptidase [Thermodesulfobacteriota bacterium]
MSKRPPPEHPHPALQKSGILLSGKALIGLMRAVHARGLPFRFTAGGHSMAPFIRDGDVVSVSPLASGDPALGDVAAFVHPETTFLCLHRVLSVNGNRFLIQGDSIPDRPDGMIPREAIIGRVTRVERAGRNVRLGLGPERLLIALLSRCGMLTRIRRYAGPLTACFSRRHASCETR